MPFKSIVKKARNIVGLGGMRSEGDFTKGISEAGQKYQQFADKFARKNYDWSSQVGGSGKTWGDISGERVAAIERAGGRNQSVYDKYGNDIAEYRNIGVDQIENDPEYRSRLMAIQEGLGGFAAGGSFLSGARQGTGARLRSDLIGDTYQNIYNRRLGEAQARYGAGLAHSDRALGFDLNRINDPAQTQASLLQSRFSLMDAGQRALMDAKQNAALQRQAMESRYVDRKNTEQTARFNTALQLGTMALGGGFGGLGGAGAGAYTGATGRAALAARQMYASPFAGQTGR